VQLRDDIADVCFLTVFLKTLIDDVGSSVLFPVRGDSLDVNAGFELAEDFPADDSNRFRVSSFSLAASLALRMAAFLSKLSFL